MSRSLPPVAAAVVVVAVAAGLRLSWHDWDEGHNLHPDERFLGMVVAAVELPSGPAQYLDTGGSPLNPANRGFGFYVYGDLPLTLTRGAAEGLEALHGAVCGAEPPAASWSAEPSLVARLCWPRGAAPDPTSLDGATRVGRLLSSLFDLGTMACLWWLARQLWGERAAVAAAALWAVTVLPIQHAHFATVDATATFFGTAALACAVWAARTDRDAALVATAVAAGLAAACRINLAPAIGLVPLAALSPAVAAGRGAPSWRRAVLGAVGGVLLAAVVFRLAMPYAFAGVVSLDDRWVRSMTSVRRMMAAPLDSGPPGVQWAGRTPLAFAVVNMVVWGMGIPLGVAAWLGWAVFAVRAVRSGDARPFGPAVLVWLWATLQIGWYGAQPVMSMRYLLPAYPAMVALASWLLTRPWHAPAGPSASWGRVAARAALPLVLASTAAWAWAFTAVYRQPHTRIEASRWLLATDPGGPRLELEDADGRRSVELTPAPVGGDRAALVIPFRPERDAALDALELPRVELVPAAGAAPSGWLRVRLSPAPSGRPTLAEAAVEVAAGRAVRVPLDGAPVRGGSWWFLVLDGMSPGEGARFGRPTVLSEHWDDGLPLALDGIDPATVFRREQLFSFDPDGPAKREHLVDRLGAADLVVLSSNRVMASIPRQSERWPLTTRFYRLLLSGRLGFEVAAEFTSYPRLGPLVFPDSETTGALGLDPDPTRMPRPGRLEVPLPPAEEAFSVYDHPRVLILRKRADFSLESAAAALGPSP